jgi:hypothetical protein
MTETTEALPAYLSGKTARDGLRLPAVNYGAERGRLRLGAWLASLLVIGALWGLGEFLVTLDPIPFVLGNRTELELWELPALVLALGALPWLVWTGLVFSGPKQQQYDEAHWLMKDYAEKILKPYLVEKCGVRLHDEQAVRLLTGYPCLYGPLERSDGSIAANVHLVLVNASYLRDVAFDGREFPEWADGVHLDVVEKETITRKRYPFPALDAV